MVITLKGNSEKQELRSFIEEINKSNWLLPSTLTNTLNRAKYRFQSTRTHSYFSAKITYCNAMIWGHFFMDPGPPKKVGFRLRNPWFNGSDYTFFFLHKAAINCKISAVNIRKIKILFCVCVCKHEFQAWYFY